MMSSEPSTSTGSDFIRDIVTADLESGKHRRVHTRFPPEPNGYLHIGHAKSICLNFGIAAEYGGLCNLRFDDTNPTTEDPEYVESMKRDVRWLGFDWQDRLYFTSDYFEQLYDYAEKLVREGKAYVDSLSEEEIRELRGTVTEPGRPSPYRDRPAEENLDLLRRMRAGEFADGSHVLRAKIDMAASNMLMRDPLLYRIRRAHHYRRGDAWCIYPMYDFAHCLSDAIEGITHSLCTLEFENNREIYDWLIREVETPHQPRQIEFARLNLSYTVLSKRKLLQLVREGHVEGWDDPRMPTLSGLRRRGYPPEAIRAFCDKIGVTKANTTIDVALVEHAVRDELNTQAPRVLGVLRPLAVVIENYPEDRVEELEAPYFPHDVPKEGSRRLPFSRRLYIERDDFREDPPKKFHRLAPGREVRLRHAYVLKCERVVKNEAGEIVELRCTYDPESIVSGRRVKGTIHWLSAAHAVPVEARLYDRLFAVERPDGDPEVDFKTHLHPKSLEVLEAWVEPSVAAAVPGSRFQFERQGYFYLDPEAARERRVWNRIVPLRDSWAKIAARKPAKTTSTSTAKAPAPPAPPAVANGEARRRPRRTAPDEGRLAPEVRERRRRYLELGLAGHEADVLAGDAGLAAFFEEALGEHDRPRSVASWVVNELVRELKERSLTDLAFGGAELGELASLVDDGTLSGAAAKEVFAEMLRAGGRPRRIVETKGLRQLDDAGELEPIVDRVLAAQGENVAAYKAGKTGLLGFFVGQVMKETRGRANGQLVRDILSRRLDAA